MQKIYAISFFVIISLRVLAQGEIDDQSKSSIRHERDWHIMLTSNGWGGGYSLANMQTIYRKTAAGGHRAGATRRERR